MLEDVFTFTSAIARHRTTAFGAALDSLTEYLLELRYDHRVVADYVRSAAHFARWLQRRGKGPDDITEAERARFVAHRRLGCRCGGALGPVNSAGPSLRHLLVVLRRQGVVRAIRSVETPASRLLSAFATHLSDDRGASASTCATYSQHAAEFLGSCFPSGGVDFDRARAADVLRFVSRRSVGLKPLTIQLIATALRSFFRFLQMRGVNVESLLAAVPRVANWKLATVPRVLSPEQLRLLMASFDRRTAVGRRDYAIASLLSTMALRAGEVAGLTLDAVDWRSETLVIRATKVRRASRMPLQPKAMRAMAAYVSDGRPVSTSRHIFVTHMTPQGRPLSSRGVRATINRGFVRGGVQFPSIGTHVLRHTAATQMLRDGATLKEIADVLRHRSIDTTAIYAKVDEAALRVVALPWPEGRP